MQKNARLCVSIRRHVRRAPGVSGNTTQCCLKPPTPGETSRFYYLQPKLSAPRFVSTQAGHHVWSDGSSVTAQDWSRPEKLGELPVFISTNQEQSPTVDSDLRYDSSQEYILKLLHKYQPSHDIDERCTAMILTSRLDVIGWVKLPCSRRLQAHFICYTIDWNAAHSRVDLVTRPRGLDHGSIDTSIQSYQISQKEDKTVFSLQA